MIRPPPRSTLFPSTTLFRSRRRHPRRHSHSANYQFLSGPFWRYHTLLAGKLHWVYLGEQRDVGPHGALDNGDRKSTRLNSSHDQISYAVFCLKKKKEHVLPVLRRRNRRHPQLDFAPLRQPKFDLAILRFGALGNVEAGLKFEASNNGLAVTQG